MHSAFLDSYALHVLVRTLSGLDRDPLSPTYGCFDRNFWQYKSTDFPSSILQQGALTLAVAYSDPFGGNIYYQKERIRDYAAAGISYWSRLVNQTGRLEEYWPHERSIPAAAFSLYAVCEASERIRFSNPDFKSAVRKAASFLKKHRDHEALNQEIASIAAIRYAAKVLSDAELKQAADQRFERFLARQEEEGWFAEYQGVDTGYLSVTLDFLIRDYEIGRDARGLGAAEKLLEFLTYFIHPDGSFGGVYCSRDSEYFLPYGFAALSAQFPPANPALRKLVQYLCRENYLNLSVDDRYLLHYLGSSVLKAAARLSDASPGDKAGLLPCERCFEKHFPKAMIYIKSTPRYYLIVSLMKGGAFLAFDKKNLRSHADAGYRLTQGEAVYTLECPLRRPYRIDGDGIRLETFFSKKKYFIQTPWKRLGMVVFFFVLKDYSASLARKIKHRFFYSAKRGVFTFRRTLVLNDAEIRVSDTLDAGRGRATAWRIPGGVGMRFMPSSKFFQIHTLSQTDPAESFEIEGKRTVETRVSFE